MVSIRRAKLSWLVLAVGVLAGLADTQSAHAGYVVCKTDPLMTFSNGVVVDLTAVTISSQAQITHASYTVHVPAGVSMTSIKYDQSAAIESVTVVADMPANQYAFHLVATTVSMTTVYENATVNGLLKIGVGLPSKDIVVTTSLFTPYAH